MKKDKPDLKQWLPTTKKEMEIRGWESLDVILVSGDAYVDHPSFGVAVIGRLLESTGLRVGLLPQPNWRDDLRDFKKLGKPNLFFGITGGSMDPMVNHYTAAKRLRSTDAYTAGGKSGFRPDYASMVYGKILKKLFPDSPVVIGGIEGSMRRCTHYDYWSDELKPSILADSGADMLIYGMGEQPVLELARLLARSVPFSSITTLPQSAILIPAEKPLPKNKRWKDIELHSHEACLADEVLYAKNFRTIEVESNRPSKARLLQEVAGKRLIINPPYSTTTEKQIDSSFALPYTRLPHPKYWKRGDIPAYVMIRHSITMHRGCFGGCSFCTISAHQGKAIVSRSSSSILAEAKSITKMPDFAGYISDLGGPSANMYKMEGVDMEQCQGCIRPSCIHPKICENLNINHHPMIDIYRKVSGMDSVKKAFVSSGVRYDMLLAKDEDGKLGLMEYAKELVGNMVSGRLKVAPEHTSERVLKLMRKPSFNMFKRFKKLFEQLNEDVGLHQQLIPYFISSHPSCELEDMAHLASQTAELGYRLEQVQDFTPTPMTLATVIYRTGINPYGLRPVYTATRKGEKDMQKRFFFWFKRENRGWILGQLERMGLMKMADKLFPGWNRGRGRNR